MGQLGLARRTKLTSLHVMDHQRVIIRLALKPTPGQPINLDASVEFYLRRIYNQPGTEISKILVDPYQMAPKRSDACGRGWLPVEEVQSDAR